MGSILYDDESGTLKTECFYEFQVMFDDEPPDVVDQDRSWIVVPRNPTDAVLSAAGRETYCYVEALPEPTDLDVRHDCRTDKLHVTGQRAHRIPFDAYGGTRIAEFIPDVNIEYTFLSSPFAARMSKLPIDGLDMLPATVKVNQSRIAKPEFVVLQFAGRCKFRMPRIENAPNACPFCGAAPILCMECGYGSLACDACGKEWRVAEDRHEGQGDKRMKVRIPAGYFKRGRILEGTTWDGADLISRGVGWNFVSKRVLDWLLTVHAAPFYVRPARIRIDGMTGPQLARLEEVQKPLDVS